MNQQPRDAISNGRTAGREAPAAGHPVSRPTLEGHALRRHRLASRVATHAGPWSGPAHSTSPPLRPWRLSSSRRW
jgi:hypothetical protein